MARTTPEILDALDAFLDRCRTRGLLAPWGSVPAVDEATLRAFGPATGRALPADLAALYRCGVLVAYIRGDGEEPGFGHTNFSSLDTVQDNLTWWGVPENEFDEDEVARGLDERDQLRYDQLAFGIPVWVDASTVVVDARDGSVGRFSGESGPSDRIAGSFAEFLEHFVACGCFDPGAADRAHFERYAALVGDAMPFAISQRDNLWLRHLDRWYPGGNLTTG